MDIVKTRKIFIYQSKSYAGKTSFTFIFFIDTITIMVTCK